LELRDGGTETSPVLAKLCGTSLPSTVLSTANVLFARFVTDNSVPRRGFKVEYSIGEDI
jgi:cubilin